MTYRLDFSYSSALWSPDYHEHPQYNVRFGLKFEAWLAGAEPAIAAMRRGDAACRFIRSQSWPSFREHCFRRRPRLRDAMLAIWFLMSWPKRASFGIFAAYGVIAGGGILYWYYVMRAS